VASATRRTNQRLTLLMLVLASITVLTLDYHGEVSRGITHVRNGIRDALSPLQRGVASALHPLGDVVDGAFHYGALQSENETLQNELGELQQRENATDFAARQANDVLALARVPFVASLALTPAEVISAPTSNFEYTLEIDRGTGSGVGPRMPVVAPRGLAGTVVSAGASTAVVRLITDKASHVAVTFGTGSAAGSGIANGEGFGEPISIGEVAGASPKAGEIAYTSGTDGGAYPSGIPVAVVASVKVAAGGLIESVNAKPLVDLRSLGFVDVCEWLPQP
jgi:rod shape-determining protein MreC